jgi:hypothetical protein
MLVDPVQVLLLITRGTHGSRDVERILYIYSDIGGCIASRGGGYYTRS